MVDPPFFAPQNERNPAPPRATPREHSVRPSLEGVIARFRLAPPQACDNLFILDFIARRSARKAVDAEGNAGWSLSFDPHFWEKFGRLDPVALAKAARSPLAVIRGAKSQLFQPEDAAHLRSIIAPGSPYVEIPEAEHHVMIDQPLAFVSALRALLAAWPAAKARLSCALIAQAIWHRLDVDLVAVGRAERVKPKARTMRITVLNSGLPVSRKRLIQAFAVQPGNLGDLAHAARAGNERQGRRAQNPHPRFQRRRDVMRPDVPPCRDSRRRQMEPSLASQRLRQHLCAFDVPPLRALVRFRTADHKLGSALKVMDAVSRPVGNSHFRHPCSHASDVAWISLFHAANASDDPREGVGVAKTVQPGSKLLRLTHFGSMSD